MTTTRIPLDFNQICSIAAWLEELGKDPETPVYVEGDIAKATPEGIEWLDMDKGEAARMAVIKVMEHPYLQGVLTERDLLWEALKWLLQVADHVPTPPDGLTPTIDSVLDAIEIEKSWRRGYPW